VEFWSHQQFPKFAQWQSGIRLQLYVYHGEDVEPANAEALQMEKGALLWIGMISGRHNGMGPDDQQNSKSAKPLDNFDLAHGGGWQFSPG
jgi:hypothetical protein